MFLNHVDDDLLEVTQILRQVRLAQILDVDGEVIKGLYAAGNVMASAMGMAYGGAGGTLGPCMVFGFIAGKHSAEELSPK